MNDQKLVHVLQPGQILSIRHDTDGDVQKNLRTMRLTSEGGNPYANAYVTFIDDVGVSVYITRGYLHGGDIEAMLAKHDVMWRSYFEPLDSFNMAYAGRKHYVKKFPLEFI